MNELIQKIKKENAERCGEGVLPAFYEKYGFEKEKEVILMGMELA